MPDRTQAPSIVHAVDYNYNLPDVGKQQLVNGCQLFWYNGGSQPVAEVTFVVEAGLWQEPEAGIANAVAHLFRSGTSTKTALQINEAFEYYGASLKVSLQNDNALVMLHCLSKHLAALIPLVAEVFFDAQFPGDEVRIYAKNSKQKLQVHLQQCDFMANRKIDALLFGEQHPYGRFSTAEKFESLSSNSLREFHQHTYAEGPMNIYLAGEVNENHLALLAQYFGHHKRKALAIKNTPAISKFIAGNHHFTNDESGLQAAVRMTTHFPNRQHPDFASLILLNTIFGGYFGSRLMANIREEKGYTYGIHSMLLPYKQGGQLTVSSEVGKDVGDATIEEVYKEMEALRNKLVEEEELLLVKNYLLGNLLGDLDGPFHIIQRWRTLIENGQDREDFYNNVERYKTTSSEKIQELANIYFKEDQFITVSVI